MNLRLVPLAVLLLTPSTLMSPQAQTTREAPRVISIGSTDLRIGMTKKAVLSLLEAHGFEQEPLLRQEKDRIESITVLRSGGGPLARAVADLYFKGGSLIRVVRQIEFKNDAEALGTIYSLVAKFAQEGRSICQLSANSREEGDKTLKTATISCSYKTIEISILQDNGGRALVLGISEVLQDSIVP